MTLRELWHDEERISLVKAGLFMLAVFALAMFGNSGR